MMHKRRRWCVGTAESPEQLATNLTERTWTLCTGFELQGYLFLNDSTSENGAQEYGVVKLPEKPGGKHFQVESITFGWCTYEKALGYIRKAIAGEMDGYDFVTEVHPQYDTVDKHGTCHLCA